MTAPLGTLLSESFSFFRRAFVPILIGAVIFGLILGIGQSFLGVRATQEVGTLFRDMGIEQETLERLQQRIAAGDQTAVEELARTLQGQADALPGGVAAASLTGFYQRFLSTMGLFLLVAWLVSVVASAFYLVLALARDPTFAGAIGRVPGLFLPLLGLSLWILIRSFVWIPLIGPIFGIILLPRFALASVLLVRDGKGVFESASLSYAGTKGYWGKIFGNVIVAALCAVVAVFVVTWVLGIFGITVVSFLGPIVSMLALSFMIVFLVQLSLTILANLRRA